MTKVEKYRKRPVEVTAVRWDGEWPPIRDWLLAVTDGVVPGIRNPDNSLNLGGRPVIRREGNDLLIDTLEGTMKASLGDWVIKGVQGEFYPCKPDIFAETYEAVGD